MIGPRVEQRWMLAVLVLALACVACRDAKRETNSASGDEERPREAASEEGPVKYIPPLFGVESPELSRFQGREATFSAWTSSADGDLSLRVAGPKAAIPVEDPIDLFVDLRNNTNEPIYVFRPLLNSYDAWTKVIVSGPNGEPNWSGPVGASPYWEYCFVTIPPGHVLREPTKLFVISFPGSDKPGPYTVEFHYIVRSPIRLMTRTRESRVESEHWAGEIRTEPITVEKRRTSASAVVRQHKEVEQ